MKDIDFEELDRAVSSLIGTPGDAKSTTTPAKPVDDDQPVSPDDSVEVRTETKTIEPEHVPKAAEAEDAVVPATPLISSGRRSGGRFMDVVHPSTNPAKTDAPKPSKTGKVLHPISDSVKPGEPSIDTEEKSEEHTETHHKLHISAPHHEEEHEHEEESAAAESTDEMPEDATQEHIEIEDPKSDEAAAEEPKEEVPAPEQAEQKSDEPKWPDPLDVVSGTGDAKPADDKAEEHNEIAPDAPDPLADQDNPSAPFLADAKVEKRPLGAFSGEGEGAEPKADSDVPSITGDVTGTPSDPQQPATAQKLPPELEGDIVNVELSEAAGPTQDPEPTAVESQNLEDHEKEQLKNDDDTKEPKNEEDKPEHAGQAAAGAVLTQTMSIPKQYQAADETTDTAEHPVFDTKEYHPPIDPHAEHANKHTVWWVAAAIILLAGTAVAFGYWVLNGL